MVHSHMENAAQGFCNVHLTSGSARRSRCRTSGWRSARSRRAGSTSTRCRASNLVADTESFDRYYEPVNERWEQVRNENDPELEPFVSRSAFVRAEPVADRATATWPRPTSGRPTWSTELAEEHLDRWLRWVDEAEPVPADERAALARPTTGDPAQHRRARPGQRDGRAVLRPRDHPTRWCAPCGAATGSCPPARPMTAMPSWSAPCARAVRVPGAEAPYDTVHLTVRYPALAAARTTSSG